MNASERSQSRRLRRPAHFAAGTVKVDQCPQESDSVHFHTPRMLRDDHEDRGNSVVVSPRSTTSTSNPQASFSPLKESAIVDLTASPPSRHVPVSGRTAARPSLANAVEETRRSIPAASPDSSSAAGPARDDTFALHVTPDKTSLSFSYRQKASVTAAAAAAAVATNRSGRIVDDDVMMGSMRPGDESLSFEIFQNGRSSGTEEYSRIPVERRLQRGPLANPSPTLPGALTPSDKLRQPYLDGGRYAALSHSSRLDDTNPLFTQDTDVEASGAAAATAAAFHRVAVLDDMVRHSTTDSIAAENDLNGAPPPPQPHMDSSTNSQSMARVTKRRNTTCGPVSRLGPAFNASSSNSKNNSNGGGGGGNNRYGSASPSGSPPASVDVASPTLPTGSGPQLVSSGQMTPLPTAHLHKHRVPAQQQHATPHCGTYGGGRSARRLCDANDEEDSFLRRQELNVLGTTSRDGSSTARTLAGVSENASASTEEDFSVVRAPIFGLRAKVLGNNAVDEEEAAEDPMAREQLAAQLKSFASKVARQRHDGPDGAAVSQNGTTAGVISTAFIDGESRAERLRRINAAANTETEATAVTVGGSTPPHAREGQGAAPRRLSAPATAATPAKKMTQEKKVRFDMTGLVVRDAEQREAGGGAAQKAKLAPRHGTPQPAGALKHHSLSPFDLVLDPTAKRPPPFTSAKHGSAAEATVPLPHADVIASPSAAFNMRSVLRGETKELPSAGVLPSSPINQLLASLSSEVAVTPVFATTDDFSNSVRMQSAPDDEEMLMITPYTPVGLAASPPSPPELVITSAKSTSPAAPGCVPPALAAGTPLTITSHEPVRRMKSAGKARKPCRTRRKAAVALVAGANDAVVLPRSSASSSVTPSAQATPLLQPQPSALSSTEVCLPEAGDSHHSRTGSKPHKSQHQQQQQQRQSKGSAPSAGLRSSQSMPSPLRIGAEMKVSKTPRRRPAKVTRPQSPSSAGPVSPLNPMQRVVVSLRRPSNEVPSKAAVPAFDAALLAQRPPAIVVPPTPTQGTGQHSTARVDIADEAATPVSRASSRSWVRSPSARSTAGAAASPTCASTAKNLPPVLPAAPHSHAAVAEERLLPSMHSAEAGPLSLFEKDMCPLVLPPALARRTSAAYDASEHGQLSGSRKSHGAPPSLSTTATLAECNITTNTVPATGGALTPSRASTATNGSFSSRDLPVAMNTNSFRDLPSLHQILPRLTSTGAKARPGSQALPPPSR